MKLISAFIETLLPESVFHGLRNKYRIQKAVQAAYCFFIIVKYCYLEK